MSRKSCNRAEIGKRMRIDHVKPIGEQASFEMSAKWHAAARHFACQSEDSHLAQERAVEPHFDRTSTDFIGGSRDLRVGPRSQKHQQNVVAETGPDQRKDRRVRGVGAIPVGLVVDDDRLIVNVG